MLQRHPIRLSCIALLALSSAAEAQLNDDFSDGDLTTGTVWNGSTALFAVVDDGGNQRLRSNSATAANYYLSTPSTVVNDAQWEWYMDLRFATSGANYVDVHLMSDAADLTGAANGYFLRCGGTADRLELFSNEGGSGFTTGLQSPDGIINSSSSNPFRIKVTRSAAGLWTLLYDDGATGSYLSAGTATDNTTTSATHFGIRIEQSSAASPVNNHFFDDIQVSAIPVDNVPPAILSVSAISATLVDVRYSEPLDAGAVGTYDIVPGIGVSAQVLDGTDATLVHVTPATALTSGNTYGLSGSGALDLAGNASIDAGVFEFNYVVPDVALPGDVVINEIMADPTPVVGLPEAEFIEVHNTTTNKSFDLAGWTFTDGSTTATLPNHVLTPGAHAIIVDDGVAALFSAFSNVIVVTTFPSLNNDGDPLVLNNGSGTTIDAVSYALTWYLDATKALGGWTLERIDPTAPCSGAANWKASSAAIGGTPSAQNSVFAIVPDNTAPALSSVQVVDASTLVLLFSEAMDVASLVSGNYTIAPAVGIANVQAIGDNSVQLTLSGALTVGASYTITVTGVSDCPGNTIGSPNTRSFALPEPVAPGDVVINEVLYDPVTGGSDFVELYNRSTKTLSLANWKLANVSNGEVSSPLTITTASYLLLPGEYALITENTADTRTRYPQSRTERFMETDMPSYNNGEGSVVLQAPDGTQLDRFDYTDDLHFGLVNDVEGYSLERIDPDRATNDNTNWQTASDVAGKATPGFRNSQYAESPDPSGELTVDRAIFSPDNDGFEDVLPISYRFQQAGFVGTLSAYDIAGREVRRILDSQLLGTEGTVSWDGLQDDGTKARMGPYILVLEVFDIGGTTEVYKKTVTLAHRLD